MKYELLLIITFLRTLVNTNCCGHNNHDFPFLAVLRGDVYILVMPNVLGGKIKSLLMHTDAKNNNYTAINIKLASCWL